MPKAIRAADALMAFSHPAGAVPTARPTLRHRPQAPLCARSCLPNLSRAPRCYRVSLAERRNGPMVAVCPGSGTVNLSGRVSRIQATGKVH
jgi:hypothetical protein